MKSMYSPGGQTLRRKHVPQRSCIACRETRDKKELIRLVCDASVVEVDINKRRVGRGAYLCPIHECWEVGLKKNRIEHALRTKLTLENRQMLIEYGESLPRRGNDQR